MPGHNLLKEMQGTRGPEKCLSSYQKDIFFLYSDSSQYQFNGMYIHRELRLCLSLSLLHQTLNSCCYKMWHLYSLKNIYASLLYILHTI